MGSWTIVGLETHKRVRNQTATTDLIGAGDQAKPEQTVMPRRTRRTIPAATIRLRQWLVDEHWNDEPCTECENRGILCFAPDANSAHEKCAGCSSSDRRCQKKWILERSNVACMVHFTEEQGMTQEQAERIVYGPAGHLGGRWDRRKDYPRPEARDWPLYLDPAQSDTIVSIPAPPAGESSRSVGVVSPPTAPVARASRSISGDFQPTADRPLSSSRQSLATTSQPDGQQIDWEAILDATKAMCSMCNMYPGGLPVSERERLLEVYMQGLRAQMGLPSRPYELPQRAFTPERYD